jgi:hypothetical protein
MHAVSDRDKSSQSPKAQSIKQGSMYGDGNGNLHKPTIHGTETPLPVDLVLVYLWGVSTSRSRLSSRIVLALYIVPRFGPQNGHYLYTIRKYFTKEDLAP